MGNARPAASDTSSCVSGSYRRASLVMGQARSESASAEGGSRASACAAEDRRATGAQGTRQTTRRTARDANASMPPCAPGCRPWERMPVAGLDIWQQVNNSGEFVQQHHSCPCPKAGHKCHSDMESAGAGPAPAAEGPPPGRVLSAGQTRRILLLLGDSRKQDLVADEQVDGSGLDAGPSLVRTASGGERGLPAARLLLVSGTGVKWKLLELALSV